MKNILFGICLAATIGFIACGDGNVLVIEDSSVQAAEDSAIIINYLADLGYMGDEVTMLESGVSYVILDEGAGESIDESDVVTFDYIGKLTNDTIFDTSIQEVADSIRLAVEANITEGDTLDIEFALLSQFTEDREYQPSVEVYSASGWTIPTGPGGYINGFAEGIAATFGLLKVGGSALVVIPSAEAYGSNGSGFLIPPNSVIAFELYPIAVDKQ